MWHVISTCKMWDLIARSQIEVLQQKANMEISKNIILQLISSKVWQKPFPPNDPLKNIPHFIKVVKKNVALITWFDWASIPTKSFL